MDALIRAASRGSRASASATLLSGPSVMSVTACGLERIAELSSRTAPPFVGSGVHGTAGSLRTPASTIPSSSMRAHSGQLFGVTALPSATGTSGSPSLSSRQRAWLRPLPGSAIPEVSTATARRSTSPSRWA